MWMIKNRMREGERVTLRYQLDNNNIRDEKQEGREGERICAKIIMLVLQHTSTN